MRCLPIVRVLGSTRRPPSPAAPRVRPRSPRWPGATPNPSSEHSSVAVPSVTTSQVAVISVFAIVNPTSAPPAPAVQEAALPGGTGAKTPFKADDVGTGERSGSASAQAQLESIAADPHDPACHHAAAGRHADSVAHVLGEQGPGTGDQTDRQDKHRSRPLHGRPPVACAAVFASRDSPGKLTGNMTHPFSLASFVRAAAGAAPPGAVGSVTLHAS